MKKKLIKIGNSQGIIIPKKELNNKKVGEMIQFNVNLGSDSTTGNNIVITSWRKDIEELSEKMDLINEKLDSLMSM